MVLALTTGHKIGLVAVGVLFIAYALVSALVLPRRYPDFPGRFRSQYYAVTALLFLAMIGAVLVFGKEQKAGTPGGVAAPGSTTAASAVSSIGDPVAGKAIFVRETCETCHVFKAGGFTNPQSKATLGPDLDNLALYARKAHYQLSYFIRAAIVAPPAPYVPPGYSTSLMSTDYGHEMSGSDINNVIAFLIQGQTK
jgi:cytochrome c551/c552